MGDYPTSVPSISPSSCLSLSFLSSLHGSNKITLPQFSMLRPAPFISTPSTVHAVKQKVQPSCSGSERCSGTNISYVYALRIRLASRTFFNIARFSLYCFFNFFTTTAPFSSKKSLGFVSADRSIFVRSSATPKV
jgi:hypothetical protein